MASWYTLNTHHYRELQVTGMDEEREFTSTDLVHKETALSSRLHEWDGMKAPGVKIRDRATKSVRTLSLRRQYLSKPGNTTLYIFETTI
ncbi:hypothetical protein ccbrp13_32710 [Ktedonobacteria bacterium brp13]|nr:hypothetical protein ccbrp13_32710 [Ktedonobacteria bacterium brp13]